MVKGKFIFSIVVLFYNQGRKVFEQKISSNEPVSVSGLARGMYIYRVMNGRNTYPREIMIR